MSGFQWSLDLTSSGALSRGPMLPKETDRCIVEYETLRDRLDKDPTEEALEEYKAFRSTIERRIEALEDFYLRHDSENKAILFEKQRLRLRRLLHSDSGRVLPRVVRSSEDGEETKGGIRERFENHRLSPIRSRGYRVIYVRLRSGRKLEVEPAQDWHLLNLKKFVAEKESIPVGQQRYVYNNNFLKVYKHKETKDGYRKGDIDERKMIEEFSKIPSGSVLKLQRPSPKMAYSTNMSPRDKFARSIHKMRANDNGENAKPVPIYEWEKDGDDVAAKYKLDAEFEFQIKLTEKEFFKLTSRRRAIGAEQRHTKRNTAKKKTESPYFQGPYVDPMRITRHIYRS